MRALASAAVGIDSGGVDTPVEGEAMTLRRNSFKMSDDCGPSVERKFTRMAKVGYFLDGYASKVKGQVILVLGSMAIMIVLSAFAYSPVNVNTNCLSDEDKAAAVAAGTELPESCGFGTNMDEVGSLLAHFRS
jgi:hypothetical protein